METNLKQESKVSKVQQGLDFPDAMRAIINGDKVTRLSWKSNKIYGFLNIRFLSLHKLDKKNYQWIINDGDLFATDWKIIK